MTTLGRVFVAALMVVAAPTSATLGGGLGSVESDRLRMSAQIRASRLPQYVTHEMLTTDGTTVREYATLEGKVFAVTWRGPQIPDLQQLFGEHFATFQQASRGAHGRRLLRIDTRGLVVQSAGHMRSYGGRAYLPGDVPAGVSIDDLK